MREVISIFIGQGGVQCGNAVWELFCLEHDIQPDGSINLNSEWNEGKDRDGSEYSDFQAIFSDPGHGKYVPRAVYIDSEPTVIDEVRLGKYRQLFHPDSMVTGKEDASNTYSRGYYTMGRNICETSLDRIRKLADDCSGLQGFMVFHALGGGTGSGLGSLLLERLSQDYEPYNSILATQTLLEHADVTFVLDNEALYDICVRKLDVERPLYSNLNRLIAQAISSITVAIRFGGEGPMHYNLCDFQNTLVLYPQIHFAMCSYAPLRRRDTQYVQSDSVSQITEEAFEPGCMMAKCDPGCGQYMACCTMYRGDMNQDQAWSILQRIRYRRTFKFVDWMPPSFRMSISYSHPPRVIPDGDIARSTRSLCDGMEEGELSEARENVAAMEKDYEDLERPMTDEE